LHHVHVLVPDVPAVEEEYAGSGFAVVARYGYLGQEYQGFSADVGWDERSGVHPSQQRFAELAGWRLEPAI
jgi:hypothetical protein